MMCECVKQREIPREDNGAVIEMKSRWGGERQRDEAERVDGIFVDCGRVRGERGGGTTTASCSGALVQLIRTH